MELYLHDTDLIVAFCVAKPGSWVCSLNTKLDVCVLVFVEGINFRHLIPKDANSRRHTVSAAAWFLYPTSVINLSDPANDGEEFGGVFEFDAEQDQGTNC